MGMHSLQFPRAVVPVPCLLREARTVVFFESTVGGGTCSAGDLCAMRTLKHLWHFTTRPQPGELGSDIRAPFPDAHTVLLCPD